MKLFKSIISTVLLVLVFSSNCFALDVQEATKDYLSLKDQFGQLDRPGKHAKTTSSVVLDTYSVDERLGLLLQATEVIGPISKSQLYTIVDTLYETTDFGVYRYNSIKVLVWYTGSSASVITLLAR
ncbi:MAG: hypothetical protein HOP02_12805 [Methylococcaceae bacterium]|nr:hypothetical protein [Methylococcaceae bacterium]